MSKKCWTSLSSRYISTLLTDMRVYTHIQRLFKLCVCVCVYNSFIQQIFTEYPYVPGISTLPKFKVNFTKLQGKLENVLTRD